MKKIIDIENWNRKEHFELFRQYEQPFWGVVSEVNVTRAYEKAGKLGVSFFVYYLYQSLRAVNAVENFRLRIEDREVVLYDRIHASATLSRKDETFAFSFMEFSDSLEVFEKETKEEMEAVENSTGLRLFGNNTRTDVIYYSALPWVKFTSLSHALNFKTHDCVPKISFGKMFWRDNKRFMAVSLHAHHALADGVHGGKFFALFQKYLDE